MLNFAPVQVDRESIRPSSVRFPLSASSAGVYLTNRIVKNNVQGSSDA